MTPAYPSNIAFYAYILGAWTLLDDVGSEQPTRYRRGMTGNKPLDRVADIGTCTVWLNNSNGLYTVGGPSALAGFKKGIPIKKVITFDGRDYTSTYYLKDLDPKAPSKSQYIRLSLVDWLDYASRHNISNPGIQSNKRGDEVLTTAAALVEIQPTDTDFDTGVETFATAFDTNTSHTTVYKEMVKVAFSELGYTYMKRDGTLRFESADARYGWRVPDNIPIASADAGRLKKHNAVLSEAFDATSGTGLSVDTNSKITGSNSFLVNVTDTTARYGQLSVTGDPQQIVVALRLRVSELTMANNNLFTFASIRSNTVPWFTMQLQYTTVGGYKINSVISNDAGGTSSTSYYAIQDGDEVKIICSISSAPGANGGSVALYINSTLKETLTGKDNDTCEITTLRFGATSGLDAGTSGNLYIDDIWWSLTDGGTRQDDIDFEVGHLLLMSGGRIIQMQSEQVEFGPADGVTIEDYEAPYGDNQINKVTVYAYPRRLSASPEVLFQLDNEIIIGSGKTYTLNGTWADLSGGLPINAQDVIKPVPSSGTDCSAFTATGGGGSNITSSLTLNNWDPGTTGFSVDLYNGDASTMYVYTFAPRGTGIRVPNPISHEAETRASVEEYEAESETLHQRYKNDLYSGIIWSDSIAEQHKDPRTVLRSITFTANKSGSAMMAFLNTEIGDLRYIEITELGIAGNYYIQGIEVEMKGLIIRVTWIVLAALSLQTGCGLTPVAVEFRGGTTADAIRYPYSPKYTNLPDKSISVWVNLDEWETANNVGVIMSVTSENYGWRLYTSDPAGTDPVLYFDQFWTNDSGGFWETNPAPFALGEWHNIIVTYNSTSTSNNPVFYIDGTSVTVNETGAPGGALYNEAGSPLEIGGWADIAGYGANGKILDPRLYDYSLTQANATAIYNGSIPSASAGPQDMIFQGLAVRTEDAAAFDGATLDSTYKLFDAQYLAVGTVHGNPIGRAVPEFVAGGAVLKVDGGGILLMSGGRLMENGRIE